MTGVVLDKESKDKSSHNRLGKPGVTGDLSNVSWITVLFPLDFYVKSTATIIFNYIYVLGTTLGKHEDNAALPSCCPSLSCLSRLGEACIIPLDPVYRH